MYLVEHLRNRRVWFQSMLHAPASSAAKLAGALHVPGKAVAKTVLVRTTDEFLLAVLPATSRIDFEGLADAIDLFEGEIRLATAEEIVASFPNCEPGAIPPFGAMYGLRTVMDAALLDQAEIVFCGHTRHEGIRMRSEDYLDVESPTIAWFAEPILGATARYVDFEADSGTYLF